MDEMGWKDFPKAQEVAREVEKKYGLEEPFPTHSTRGRRPVECEASEQRVHFHQTATAWKGHDPMARSSANAIRERVQQRYGIDVDALGTGADGAAALNEAARANTHAQEKRTAVAAENIQEPRRAWDCQTGSEESNALKA